MNNIAIKKNSSGNSKSVNLMHEKIDDLNIRHSERKQVPKQAIQSKDIGELEDDDFFNNIQNKSKILPDDEIFLNEDEKLDIEESNRNEEDKMIEELESFNSFKPVIEKKEEIFSEEDLQLKKQHFLMKIERFRKQGFFPRRKLTLASKLEDIKFEYDCLFRERSLENSIKEWREDIVLYSAGAERVNEWIKKPIYLDDWSKQVYRDTDEGYYDAIIEQLHDEYGGPSMLPAPIQLVKAMGLSAIRYHFAHKVKEDAPDIHAVLEHNPDLRDKVYEKMHSESVKAWADKKPEPKVSAPKILPVGTNRVQQSMPVKEVELKGPSMTTEELLNTEFEHINSVYDEKILHDSDEETNSVKLKLDTTPAKKKTTRRKKSVNIGTIDL